LNEPAAHILYSVPTGAKYKEVTVVLENHYGDHYLAETFHAQLRKSQHARKSLQEFAAVIGYLPMSYRHGSNQNLHTLSFEFSVVTRNNRIDEMGLRHMFSRFHCKLLKTCNAINNERGTYFPILRQDQGLTVSTALLPSNILPLQESD
jgi:hypothetical protein